MDITSFILGISSVIVVALVTGVVIGLVKIRKLIEGLQDLNVAVNTNTENLYNELTAIGDKGERRWDEHYRSLDSRFDKLISRIQLLEEKSGITKGKKQLLND